MTTAEIIVSLWAGTRGYLDKALSGFLQTVTPLACMDEPPLLHM